MATTYPLHNTGSSLLAAHLWLRISCGRPQLAAFFSDHLLLAACTGRAVLAADYWLPTPHRPLLAAHYDDGM